MAKSELDEGQATLPAEIDSKSRSARNEEDRRNESSQHWIEKPEG